MDKPLIVMRRIPQEEIPWCSHDFIVGTNVWLYTGHTYGVISPGGVAVTFKKDEGPFFELPANALKEKE